VGGPHQVDGEDVRESGLGRRDAGPNRRAAARPMAPDPIITAIRSQADFVMTGRPPQDRVVYRRIIRIELTERPSVGASPATGNRTDLCRKDLAYGHRRFVLP